MIFQLYNGAEGDTYSVEIVFWILNFGLFQG